MGTKKESRARSRPQRKSDVWSESVVVEAIINEQKRLGERLRALRATRTQLDVATSASLSPRVLQRIEQGETNVTLATLVALAIYYRVRLADLFD